MINRDKYLIMRNILKYLSTESRTRTRILNGCGLSHSQLIYYLGKMVESDLLHVDDVGSKIYTITGKGMQALEILTRIYEECPFILNAEPGERINPQW